MDGVLSETPTAVPTPIMSPSPVGSIPSIPSMRTRSATGGSTAAPSVVSQSVSAREKEKEERSSEKASLKKGTERVGVVDGDNDEEEEEPTFPDGGWRAWAVVVGAMCCTGSTFGFANAWGVFQSYYEKTLLSDVPPSTIAWIGSIQYSLVFLPSIVAGRLCDLGYFRVPFATGTVIVVLATFLVAQCTQYWQFLLCHGMLLGLGSGICFGGTLPVVGHWFKRNRGLALGLTATGSSIGGTVYPIAARQLIPVVGFPWTMRIMGFCMLATLGLSNLTMRRRLPPKDLPGGMFNIAVFKSPAFSVYCVSGFVCFLGIYTVLTYIDTAATHVGVSPDFSFYLVSIANASAGPSRIITGVLADRYGALNVIIPSTWVAAALTLAWPYAKSQGSLVAVAILYGASNAAFVASFNLPLYLMGDMGDIGRRMGMVLAFSAAGALVGPPISGAIYRETGGFNAVSYYAGGAILGSTVLMIITKRLVIGSWRGKF